MLLGGVAVSIAALVMLSAWILSQGPVSISFLTPYLQDHLNDSLDQPVDVQLGNTVLTWAGWDRTLDVRMIDMRVTEKNGATIATIPETAFSISPSALILGEFALSSLELFGPQLKIIRQVDGDFVIGFSDESEGKQNFFGGLIGGLLPGPEQSAFFRHLTRISIVSADLHYIDKKRNTTMTASMANADVFREDGGLRAELALEMNVSGQATELSVLADYNHNESRLDLGISLDAFHPAHFETLFPEYAAISAFDLPLSGSLTVGVNFAVPPEDALEGLDIDLTGGAGYLAMPVRVAQDFGMLSLAQRLEVETFALRGRYEGRSGDLMVEDLSVQFTDGEKLYLPPPLDHEMPIHGLAMRGRYVHGAGLIDVEHLAANLGGPELTIVSSVEGLKRAPQNGVWKISGADITTTFSKMPTSDAVRYWPSSVLVDARTWVSEHLADGMLDNLRSSVAMRTDSSGKMRLVSVAGDMAASGVTVDYLPPMPKVRNAHAKATFNERALNIEFISGESKNLHVTGGKMVLSGLNQQDQYADITVNVDGPLKNALEMIDNEPFAFASALGLSATDAAGESKTKIDLQFMLEKTLSFEKVKVSASSSLRDVRLGGVLFDRDLTDGVLELKTDKEGMDLVGQVRLGAIPVNLVWRENFAKEALFRSQYDLSGRIEDLRAIGDLGLEHAPLIEHFAGGAIDAAVSFTKVDDIRRRLRAKLDLTDTALSVAALGWSKKPGETGTAEMDIRFRGEEVDAVPVLSVVAADMSVQGSATYGPLSKIEKIKIDHIQYGRTHLTGSIMPRDDDLWEVVFRGREFDLAPFWRDMVRPSKEGALDDLWDGLRFNVAADIHQLWLGEERYIEDVVATFMFDKDRWQRVDLTSVVGGKANLQALLGTRPDGQRLLSVHTDDAGEALRAFDLYRNMQGGTMIFGGVLQERKPRAGLAGRMNIRQFRLLNTPVLAKLMSVLSLSGLVDALSGEGVAFDELDAPYAYRDGVVLLGDSRAYGPALGVTTSGAIDLRNEALDLKGTLAPAYSINALLEDIPLLGPLLSGPEKGSGVFAATYTIEGVGENVEVSVNPLSALAPGVLRNLFGKDKGGDKAKAKPQAPASETPARAAE